MWSDCSAKPCGPGQQRRDRVCDNPTPRWGGKHCFGSSFQKNKCSTPCPGKSAIVALVSFKMKSYTKRARRTQKCQVGRKNL